MLGSLSAMMVAEEKLQEHKLHYVSLNMKTGFHSPSTITKCMHIRPPNKLFVSSLTGCIVKHPTDLRPEHWMQHACNPVLFAIQNLVSEMEKNSFSYVFIETGLSPLLTRIAAKCFKQHQDTAYLSLLDAKGSNSAICTILHVLAYVYSHTTHSLNWMNCFIDTKNNVTLPNRIPFASLSI